MARGIYTFRQLTPEQEQALKEAEQSLGGGILLAFSDNQVRPADLSPSQLECLQGLEDKMGMTILAVEPD